MNNTGILFLGIYETLDTKSIYQLNVSYLIKLFSNYLRNDESNVLLQIHLQLDDQILCDNENDLYSIFKPLHEVCLKKVKINSSSFNK